MMNSIRVQLRRMLIWALCAGILVCTTGCRFGAWSTRRTQTPVASKPARQVHVGYKLSPEIANDQRDIGVRAQPLCRLAGPANVTEYRRRTVRTGSRDATVGPTLLGLSAGLVPLVIIDGLVGFDIDTEAEWKKGHTMAFAGTVGALVLGLVLMSMPWRHQQTREIDKGTVDAWRGEIQPCSVPVPDFRTPDSAEIRLNAAFGDGRSVHWSNPARSGLEVTDGMYQRIYTRSSFCDTDYRLSVGLTGVAEDLSMARPRDFARSPSYLRLVGFDSTFTRGRGTGGAPSNAGNGLLRKDVDACVEKRTSQCAAELPAAKRQSCKNGCVAEAGGAVCSLEHKSCLRVLDPQTCNSNLDKCLRQIGLGRRVDRCMQRCVGRLVQDCLSG